MVAILLTCCGLKCAVSKQKINHFEVVNRKNTYVTSKKHSTFPGKGMVLCLTVLEPQCAKERSLISMTL